MLRVHGQDKRYYYKYLGIGGRLDTIQAAILKAKLPYFKNELIERENIAKYKELIKNDIEIPIVKLTVRLAGDNTQ